MKILFVINMLMNRGADQQLFDVITKLSYHISVHVFTFSESEEGFPELVKSGRVKIHFNRHFGRYNVLKAKSLLACLFKEHYDVIITLGTGAALFLGRICAVLRKIRIIYSELHTFDNLNTGSNEYFEIPNRILNALFPWIPGQRIKKFLPVCDRLSEKIRLTVNRYPVETLYNGIRIEDINKILACQPSERAELIFHKFSGHPAIAQVGTLDENKNQLFTLKCVKALKARIPDIRCLIIGDGDAMPELTSWTMANDLKDHVIFTGHLNRTDCHYLISKSDILTLTSYSEAFPIVLIEAQAFSIPVIAFDVGGISDIIENGTTGYVIERGDYKAFKRSLLKLLTDEALAKRMGQNARQKVFAKFTIEKRVERLVSMIETDLYAVLRIDKKR